MNERIKEFFVGRECHNCEALGVHCVQVGIFTFGVPAENGQSAIYIDGKAVLRTREKINQCTAITGQNSKEEVVAKLRKNAQEAWGTVVVDQVGNY